MNWDNRKFVNQGEPESGDDSWELGDLGADHGAPEQQTVAKKSSSFWLLGWLLLMIGGVLMLLMSKPGDREPLQTAAVSGEAPAAPVETVPAATAPVLPPKVANPKVAASKPPAVVPAAEKPAAAKAVPPKSTPKVEQPKPATKPQVAVAKDSKTPVVKTEAPKAVTPKTPAPKVVAPKVEVAKAADALPPVEAPKTASGLPPAAGYAPAPAVASAAKVSDAATADRRNWERVNPTEISAGTAAPQPPTEMLIPPKSFVGAITLRGVGQRPLMLSIRENGQVLSGEAEIQGVAHYTLQGKFVARGIEFYLFSGESQLRFTGAESGMSIRGRFFNPQTGENGSWEATRQ